MTPQRKRKRFQELRERMPPESQARVAARTEELKAEYVAGSTVTACGLTTRELHDAIAVQDAEIAQEKHDG